MAAPAQLVQKFKGTIAERSSANDIIVFIFINVYYISHMAVLLQRQTYQLQDAI